MVIFWVFWSKILDLEISLIYILITTSGFSNISIKNSFLDTCFQIGIWLYLGYLRPTLSTWLDQNAYYGHICCLIALLMVPMGPLDLTVHWFGVFGSLWEQIWNKMPLYCSENQVLMQFSVSYFNFFTQNTTKAPKQWLTQSSGPMCTIRGAMRHQICP